MHCLLWTQKERKLAMSKISIVFVVLLTSASLYIHAVLCQNVVDLSDKTYDMVKGSLIREDDEVFGSGETCKSVPLCALKCLYSGCRIWVYGTNSQQCLMLLEYKEFLIATPGDPNDLAWSNGYSGKRFTVIIYIKG